MAQMPSAEAEAATAMANTRLITLGSFCTATSYLNPNTVQAVPKVGLILKVYDVEN